MGAKQRYNYTDNLRWNWRFLVTGEFTNGPWLGEVFLIDSNHRVGARYGRLLWYRECAGSPYFVGLEKGGEEVPRIRPVVFGTFFSAIDTAEVEVSFQKGCDRGVSHLIRLALYRFTLMGAIEPLELSTIYGWGHLRRLGLAYSYNIYTWKAPKHDKVLFAVPLPRPWKVRIKEAVIRGWERLLLFFGRPIFKYKRIY